MNVFDETCTRLSAYISDYNLCGNVTECTWAGAPKFMEAAGLNTNPAASLAYVLTCHIQSKIMGNYRRIVFCVPSIFFAGFHRVESSRDATASCTCCNGVRRGCRAGIYGSSLSPWQGVGGRVSEEEGQRGATGQQSLLTVSTVSFISTLAGSTVTATIGCCSTCGKVQYCAVFIW